MELVLKRDGTPTPLLAVTCMMDITRRGINELGLFRLAGDAVEIQKLKALFETCTFLYHFICV